MENNKFFKLLWRANAIFLFAAGLLLIGILLFALGLMVLETRVSHTPPPSVSDNTHLNQAEETFRLKIPSRNYNQNGPENYTYFELRTGTDSYGKFSSSKNSQIRNIAVYNLNSSESHWLFPNAQQEIEGFAELTKNLHEQKITTGYLLTVAKSLPDGTVSRDLWVMSPDGKDLKELLADIKRRPDIETYGENKIKLIFEMDTSIDIYPFDVDALTIGTPTQITIP